MQRQICVNFYRVPEACLDVSIGVHAYHDIHQPSVLNNAANFGRAVKFQGSLCTTASHRQHFHQLIPDDEVVFRDLDKVRYLDDDRTGDLRSLRMA